MEEDHPLVKSFTNKIKDPGISGESFRITLTTSLNHGKENWKLWKMLLFIYDEDNAPGHPNDGRHHENVVIVTAGLVTDDIDTGKSVKAIDCSRRASDLG